MNITKIIANSQNPPSYLRIEDRPISLTIHLRTVFQTRSSNKINGYLITDNSMYGFSGEGIGFCIEGNFCFSGPGQIKILDIGAGEGNFMAAMKKKYPHIEIFGITAQDLKNPHFKLDAQHYQILDAEFLLDGLANSSIGGNFHYIFSILTFRHLIDPLGALVQAYRALAPNGILIVDSFFIPELRTHFATIVYSLKKRGYKFAADFNQDGFLFLCIQKTFPELKLPIRYNRNPTSEQVYVCTEELLHTEAEETKQVINPFQQKIESYQDKEVNYIMCSICQCSNLNILDTYHKDTFWQVEILAKKPASLKKLLDQFVEFEQQERLRQRLITEQDLRALGISRLLKL